jgi:hypothetical protein
VVDVRNDDFLWLRIGEVIGKIAESDKQTSDTLHDLCAEVKAIRTDVTAIKGSVNAQGITLKRILEILTQVSVIAAAIYIAVGGKLQLPSG